MCSADRNSQSTSSPASEPRSRIRCADSASGTPTLSIRLLSRAIRKDDYLVALALSTGVEAVTSGDDDLHAAKNLGVEVLTPRELLVRLGV